jgi:hypothetical protein
LPDLKDVMNAWIMGQKLIMQIMIVAGIRKNQPALLSFALTPFPFLLTLFPPRKKLRKAGMRKASPPGLQIRDSGHLSAGNPYGSPSLSRIAESCHQPAISNASWS